MLTDDKIIFLISLPRSGSTLLQRILSTQPEIDTLAETWLLLPLFHAHRQSSTYASYGHTTAANAIEEFCSRMPGGSDDFLVEMKDAYLRLVTKAISPGASCFLEKTPRNILILNDLMKTFKNAKFIFLWRHPLAILNSMANTFGKGNWKIYKNRVDLYDGLQQMVNAKAAFGDRILSIRYEELVQDPATQIQSLSQYLSININHDSTRGFIRNEIPGTMGDPTRNKKYPALSTQSVDAWRSGLNTTIRRVSAKRYLKWINHHDLNPAGYDLSSAIEWGPLSMNPWSWIKDVFFSAYGNIDTILEVNQLRRYWGNDGKQLMRRRHY